MSDNNNQKLIDQLRAATDWLEEHPDFPDVACGTMRFLHYCRTPGEFYHLLPAFGSGKKDPDGNYFGLTKKIPGDIEFHLYHNRDAICHRIKVGEKLIPAQPEKVIPAEPEKVVEVYEWKCPESILQEATSD